MCQAQHSEPIVTADARPRRADPGRVRGLDCPGSLHLCGDPVAAAHWFERNRGACGPAALYTEEYDVRQRQLRGNLPRAFVHTGMLESAVVLSRDVDLGVGA